MKGGGGFPRQEEIPVFDEAGLAEAFAGQNLGQQAVIGGHIDPAGSRANRQSGPVRADPGIDHGHNHGAGGEGAGGLGEKVRSSTDIEDGAVVGKVEEFGCRIDSFYRTLELAHVGIIDPEIRIKSHEVAHPGTRLASNEPREKQGKEQENACHGLF